MTNTNYLFNLRKISNSNNNKSPVIIYGNTIQTPNNLETLIGPTGAAGDRFATKTPYELILKPSANTILIFKVEPGLAYISGNSVIVAEVGDNINSELNTFEGTIQFYSKKTGEIVIKDIVNMNRTTAWDDFNINLTSVTPLSSALLFDVGDDAIITPFLKNFLTKYKKKNYQSA